MPSSSVTPGDTPRTNEPDIATTDSDSGQIPVAAEPRDGSVTENPLDREAGLGDEDFEKRAEDVERRIDELRADDDTPRL